MKRILISLAALFVLAIPAVAAPAVPAPSDSLMQSLLKQAPGLRESVLKLALEADQHATQRGLVKRPNLLTVIDYSLPSSQPRLFTFDLLTHRLIFRELVAHGKNSGGNEANFFSNDPGSLASSLGLYVTGDTYIGHNGYSLRLNGLEQGVNDMASERAIVLHGAYYVSKEAIKALGRLGRSWGCPAVRAEIAQKVIDTLRGGSAIFAYYPDKNWLSTSAFLK